MSMHTNTKPMREKKTVNNTLARKSEKRGKSFDYVTMIPHERQEISLASVFALFVKSPPNTTSFISCIMSRNLLNTASQSAGEQMQLQYNKAAPYHQSELARDIRASAPAELCALSATSD